MTILKPSYIHDTVNHIDDVRQRPGPYKRHGEFLEADQERSGGTDVAVEPFHLDRYMDQQMFRFNNRATKDNPLNDSDRFLLALSQVSNKRLTFKELTGKEEGGVIARIKF